MELVTARPTSLAHAASAPCALRSALSSRASAKPYRAHAGLPSEKPRPKMPSRNLSTPRSAIFTQGTVLFGKYQLRTTNCNRRPHRCPSTPETSTAATAPAARASATPARRDPTSGTASTTRRPPPTARSRRTILPANSLPSRPRTQPHRCSHCVPRSSSPLPQGHPNVHPSRASRALRPAPQSPRHPARLNSSPAARTFPARSLPNPTSAGSPHGGPTSLADRDQRPRGAAFRAVQSALQSTLNWFRALAVPGRGRWRR